MVCSMCWVMYNHLQGATLFEKYSWSALKALSEMVTAGGTYITLLLAQHEVHNLLYQSSCLLSFSAKNLPKLTLDFIMVCATCVLVIYPHHSWSLCCNTSFLAEVRMHCSVANHYMHVTSQPSLPS